MGNQVCYQLPTTMKIIASLMPAFFGSAAIAASISPHHVANQIAPCTFTGSTGFDLLSKRNSSCQDIILSDLEVPAGVTLNLDNLNPGTSVTFTGKTVFPFFPAGWAGPLLSISSSSQLTIRGLPSSLLYGSGESYWDGLGQNGPITKPKFFQVHNLIDSVIEGITIFNAPVQVFSINGCKNVTLSGVTVDNKAGDGDWNAGKGGRNTDAFDIGSSTEVRIEGAQVWNQDDCVAINSGTVSFLFFFGWSFAKCLTELLADHYFLAFILHRISLSATVFAQEAMVCQLVPLAVEVITPSRTSCSRTR